MLLRTDEAPAFPIAERAGAKQPRRWAAATVEMAFVAPILFLFTLGSVEFGRAMMVANLLTSAAREGARAGALPSASTSEITAAVNLQLQAGAIPSTHAKTTVLVNGNPQDAETALTGDTIHVKVNVPYRDVTWLPTTLFLRNSYELRSQVVMRRE